PLVPPVVRATVSDPATSTQECPKILRIIARLNIGGPARHVMLLEQHLPALGYQSLLVHGQPDTGEAELLSDVRIDRILIPELGRSVRPASDITTLRRLIALMFRIRPDIV